MANPKHLEKLLQGGESWTKWRGEFPRLTPDLSEASLCGVNLTGVDLRGSNLTQVNLTQANLRRSTLLIAKLSGANLSGANLSNADLSGANLSGADLSNADLSGATLLNTNLQKANLRAANLQKANLRAANLQKANLRAANLQKANLRAANLQKANLHKTDLSDANLSNADLHGATFLGAQALRTDFTEAILTGACLQDWNINSATIFQGAICDYIYLQSDCQERRPRGCSFSPGEFSALFQQVVDTVDLIFTDGVEWQAFFQTCQDLRSRYSDQNLSIQSLEKKPNGAFVVRLEVSGEVNKLSVEDASKEIYETKLALIRERYHAELRIKDSETYAYKEQTTNLMEMIRLLVGRPINVEATAVAESTASKYNLSNAQFAGGFAETVQGNQIGGTINNYSPNTEDITRLLTALRDQAQAFPTDQKDDANDALDLLERDLKEEQPDQGRISRRLKKLVALGAAIGTIASGAAAVSGDVSTFTGNVIELTEQLGIPIEQVQLPSSGTP